MNNFGQKLRELRKKRGLSQIRLATAAGISPSYLSRIEHGDRGIPNPPCLASLAKCLGMSAGDLMQLAGYDTGHPASIPEHWHSILADPALDETIKELGFLTDAEMKGLQLYLHAIKLQRNQKNE